MLRSIVISLGFSIHIKILRNNLENYRLRILSAGKLWCSSSLVLITSTFVLCYCRVRWGLVEIGRMKKLSGLPSHFSGNRPGAGGQLEQTHVSNEQADHVSHCILPSCHLLQ